MGADLKIGAARQFTVQNLKSKQKTNKVHKMVMVFVDLAGIIAQDFNIGGKAAGNLGGAQ